MAITFEIPAETENVLRTRFPDLEGDAREAILIEFYRQDVLSSYELSRALNVTRFELDAVLKRHKVTEDQPTSDELAEDFRQAQMLMKQ